MARSVASAPIDDFPFISEQAGVAIAYVLFLFLWLYAEMLEKAKRWAL